MAIHDDVLHALRTWFLGEHPSEIAQVAASALIMYVVALWVVRTGKKRFLGRNSVFDVILAFILGSTLARAINGGAPIVSTAIAGFVLIGLHWVFGVLAHRSSRFGLLVKGGKEQVVADGRMLEDAMARHHVTKHDVEEAMRMQGIDSLTDVKEAHFERNGSISIVPRFRAEIVEVEVQDGVQKVTIEVKV